MSPGWILALFALAAALGLWVLRSRPSALKPAPVEDLDD